MSFAQTSPDLLPPAVQSAVTSEAHAGLKEVGSGTYRKFGFRVYNATLWAPNGKWDPQKPYALELRYTRSVSKDTLIDTVTDNIRDQHVADEPTLAKWETILNQALPAVNEGDVMVGLAVPGKPSTLFINGSQVAHIDDQTFSKAFFNIWLGDGADEDLRNDLTHSGSN